jgi:hypothetical protein
MNIIESVAVLLFLLIAPESPTWLLNNKDYLKCSHSLRYLAKTNGKELDRDLTYQLLKQQMPKKQVPKEKVGLSQLFSGGEAWVLIRCVILFSVSINLYYLCIFTSTKIH